MKSNQMKIFLSVIALYVGGTIGLAQAPGLKVKVTKQSLTGKSGDKTETIYLKVEMENTGQVAYKDLQVSWFVVLEKEPERAGALPKKTCLSGNKTISLLPKDTTSFESTQASVSKSGVGFYWDPGKKAGWNPKYHGYGLRIVAGGRVISGEYQPVGNQKTVEEWEIQQAAEKKK